MQSSTSFNHLQKSAYAWPGQENGYSLAGITPCNIYIALHGRTPDSAIFCEKVMRAHGIDPAKVPGYGLGSTPNFVARPAAQTAAGLSDKPAAEASMRRATLEGPGPLGPMCGIAYNSSVAELREIVERMGLAMTSSSLFNVSQALDSNGGQSVLNDPELFDIEQAILLKHCLICLDKDLEPSHLYPILGALHSIARVYNAVLVVHTDIRELSLGRCVANLDQATCREERFDPCAPQALLERLDKQHEHTGPGTIIPVFISDVGNLKLIEASYPNRSVASPSDDNAPMPRVTLTIREYLYRTPKPECQSQPPGGPPRQDSYTLPLAVGLPSAAALLIGVGCLIRERIRMSRVIAAPLEVVPYPRAASSVTTTVDTADLEDSTESSGAK